MRVDKPTFRRVIGSFATGVTVITTGRDGDYHGMTANAIASLSLEPLLVLVCIEKSAQTYAVLDRCGYFNVNILAEGQGKIAKRFADKGLKKVHDLRGTAFRLGESGVPLLDGCLAYLECKITDRYDGGDHTIFVGAVDAAEVSEQSLRPLIFYQSEYTRLAE